MKYRTLIVICGLLLFVSGCTVSQTPSYNGPSRTPIASSSVTTSPVTTHPSDTTPVTGNSSSEIPSTGNSTIEVPSTGNSTIGVPSTGNTTTGVPSTSNSTIETPVTGNPTTVTPTVISDITAKSGSAADIQAAADLIFAMGGGTVHIPEGDFSLGGSVTIRRDVKLVGAGMDKTIIRTRGTSMVVQATGENIRISGFSLISTNYDGGNGIKIDNCIDFRVDHLHIEGYSDEAGVFVTGVDTRGVIDHCYIKMKPVSNLGYGVVIYRDDVWNEDMQLGTKYAVFIEDSTFVNARHAVAANAGAHYVFRHNLVQQGVVGQQVDAHGAYWGSKEGTRAVEVYDNVIENPTSGSERAIGIRGGGGVIFNNVIKGYEYAVLLHIEDGQDLSLYPVYHQVHDLYIWDNSYDGTAEVVISTQNNSREFIKENRDYFRYAKPDYVPYPYPHPLTLEDEPGTEESGKPSLDPIGNKTVLTGQLLEFTISGTDPDSDNLTYTASNLPPGATFDPATHMFAWTPDAGQAGSYSDIHFEVTDGTLIDSEDITIAVSIPVSLPLRVNTGGGVFVDSLGNTWEADRPYANGPWGFYGSDRTADRGNQPISGTQDDGIYQKERWGLSGYIFNLPNGTYTVVLHFAETFAPGTGRRVFDVSVQGKLVLDNLDIYKEVGMDTALTKTIPDVKVVNGLLNIAITENIDLSEINGIEIMESGTS